MTEELDDEDRLAADFPSWTIGDRWVTAGTGPDRRWLIAWRDGVTVTALTTDGLRWEIQKAGG